MEILELKTTVTQIKTSSWWIQPQNRDTKERINELEEKGNRLGEALGTCETPTSDKCLFYHREEKVNRAIKVTWSSNVQRNFLCSPKTGTDSGRWKALGRMIPRRRTPRHTVKLLKRKDQKPEHIHSCGRKTIWGTVSFSQKPRRPEESAHYFSGAQSCPLRASCPMQAAAGVRGTGTLRRRTSSTAATGVPSPGLSHGGWWLNKIHGNISCGCKRIWRKCLR